MTKYLILESQQSLPMADATRPGAGCWKLAPGRALSLRPWQPSEIAVVHGRVWLTMTGFSRTDVPGAVVDHVLQAGDRLTIPAGRHVVLEAWSPAQAPDEVVAFSWDVSAGVIVPMAPVAPMASPAPRAPQSAPSAPSDVAWERGVIQPLRDLAWAMAQVGAAAGRLALGVIHFALLRAASRRERAPSG